MFTKFSHNAVAFNRRVNVCQFHVPPTQRLSLATKLPRIEFRRNAVTAAEPVVKRTRLFSLRNLGRLFKGLTILGIGYAGYSIYRLKHPPKHQLPFNPLGLPTLVLLGTGWGTTAILQNLDTEFWNVVVISPRNYFLFTPLLPSCTVGTLELRSLMMPLRSITGYKKRHVQFIEGETIDIDPDNKTVTFRDISQIKGDVDEGTIKYDYLVVGVGAENATFGIPGVRENACFLKEIWDAKKIRRKLMDCIESAHFPGQTMEEVDRLLHMVVVGGGPTGVEYAAELRDFLVEDLVKWYPEIAQRLRITLVEAMDHVLPMFNRKLVEYTEKHFNDENISLRLNTMVKEVTDRVVKVQEKKKIPVETVIDGTVQTVEEEVVEKYEIPYGLLVWATGNGVRPVVKDLMSKLPQDVQDSRRGLVIDEHLRVKGAQHMFSLGDCSSSKWTATAQVANQQGLYLGKLLNRKGKRISRLTDRGDSISQAMEKVDQGEGDLSFDYVHRGALAYIGTDKAIADLPGGVQLAGIATFLFWRSVYLSTLFSMRNKMMLMWDWSRTLVFGRDISRE